MPIRWQGTASTSGWRPTGGGTSRRWTAPRAVSYLPRGSPHGSRGFGLRKPPSTVESRALVDIPTVTRFKDWPVPGGRPPRRGWHGRSVPCRRHQSEASGRSQGAPCVAGDRRCSRRAPQARGGVSCIAEPPEHRTHLRARGLRRSCRSEAATSNPASAIFSRPFATRSATIDLTRRFVYGPRPSGTEPMKSSDANRRRRTGCAPATTSCSMRPRTYLPRSSPSCAARSSALAMSSGDTRTVSTCVIHQRIHQRAPSVKRGLNVLSLHALILTGPATPAESWQRDRNAWRRRRHTTCAGGRERQRVGARGHRGRYPTDGEWHATGESARDVEHVAARG